MKPIDNSSIIQNTPVFNPVKSPMVNTAKSLVDSFESSGKSGIIDKVKDFFGDSDFGEKVPAILTGLGLGAAAGVACGMVGGAVSPLLAANVLGGTGIALAARQAWKDVQNSEAVLFLPILLIGYGVCAAVAGGGAGFAIGEVAKHLSPVMTALAGTGIGAAAGLGYENLKRLLLDSSK